MVELARSDRISEGQPIPLDIFLLEATIHYRDGRPESAWKITQNILDHNASPPPLLQAKTDEE